MASGGVVEREQQGVRADLARPAQRALAAGLEATSLLAEAERLRALAVAQLVDFDLIDGHIAEGYATPERHLIHRGNVATKEATRLQRVVTFCAQHTLVADALEAGEITVDHADVLRTACHVVGADAFDNDVLDLLAAADHVELAVFARRVEAWTWRKRPSQTGDEVEATFEQRSLTTQRDVFGGGRGQFQLDAAGMASLELALDTTPDPADSLVPPRTLAQRKADRLVELADFANSDGCSDCDDDRCEGAAVGEPTGARARRGASVDVVIDLPTLFGDDFDLDDHRTGDGVVDWASIRSELSSWGHVPKRVLSQFFCDASYRQLITSGPRVVLDYNVATPDISPALRRAVQRRDRCCQFDGCDRSWDWCDVHHLVPKGRGGPTNEQNLALVCRFHHTLIHQGGWQLTRRPDGRLLTTSP